MTHSEDPTPPERSSFFPPLHYSWWTTKPKKLAGDSPMFFTYKPPFILSKLVRDCTIKDETGMLFFRKLD